MEEIKDTFTCKYCRFFVEIKTGTIGQLAGQCRKGPPVPLIVPQGGGLGIQTAFPILDGKDYCFGHDLKIFPKFGSMG